MSSSGSFPLHGRKSTRSCIFSGSSRGSTTVPPLHTLCFNIVKSNILSYHSQPVECFDTFRPILAKLSIAQLRQFITANRDLIEDCDVLFRAHCYAEFKLPSSFKFDEILQRIRKSKFGQAHPEALDNVFGWTQLYELLSREQEYRLQQLNDSIQRNKRLEKQKERKTMVIDTTHRRQATLGLGRIPTPAVLPIHRVSPATKAVGGSNKRVVAMPSVAKPVAPLMRKCLDLKKRYNALLK